jgi:hypothetical protein
MVGVMAVLARSPRWMIRTICMGGVTGRLLWKSMRTALIALLTESGVWERVKPLPFLLHKNAFCDKNLREYKNLCQKLLKK